MKSIRRPSYEKWSGGSDKLGSFSGKVDDTKIADLDATFNVREYCRKSLG